MTSDGREDPGGTLGRILRESVADREVHGPLVVSVFGHRSVSVLTPADGADGVQRVSTPRVKRCLWLRCCHVPLD